MPTLIFKFSDFYLLKVVSIESHDVSGILRLYYFEILIGYLTTETNTI